MTNGLVKILEAALTFLRNRKEVKHGHLRSNLEEVYSVVQRVVANYRELFAQVCSRLLDPRVAYEAAIFSLGDGRRELEEQRREVLAHAEALESLEGECDSTDLPAFLSAFRGLFYTPEFSMASRDADAQSTRLYLASRERSPDLRARALHAKCDTRSQVGRGRYVFGTLLYDPGIRRILLGCSLALLLSPTPAAADQPDLPALQIIERHFEAIGGIQTLRGITSSTSYGTASSATDANRPFRADWHKQDTPEEVLGTLRLEQSHQGRQMTCCYRDEFSWCELPSTKTSDGEILRAMSFTLSFEEIEVTRAQRQWAPDPLLCHYRGTCTITLHEMSTNSRSLWLKSTYPDATFDLIEIDPGSYYINQVSRYLPSHNQPLLSLKFGDYRTVKEIRIPFWVETDLITHGSDPAATTTTNIISKVDINGLSLECGSPPSPSNIVAVEKKIVTPSVKKVARVDMLTQRNEINLGLKINEPGKATSWLYSYNRPYRIRLDYENLFADRFKDALCRGDLICHEHGASEQTPASDLYLGLDFSGNIAIVHYSRSNYEEPEHWTDLASTFDISKHLSFSLSATLSAFDHEGKRIEVIQSYRTERATGRMGWSEESTAKKKAERAIEYVLHDLIARLQSSEAIRRHLAWIAERRQRPSQLAVTADFDDSQSLFPNRRLDAGETALLSISVSNTGPGPAFGVSVRADPSNPAVQLQQQPDLGDLAPGESRDLAIPVVASLDLADTALRFDIETKEKRGYGPGLLRLEVQGSELLMPALSIPQIVLNDRTGRARGDGDGIPANGETVEVIWRVANRGPGDAVGVRFDVSGPEVELVSSPDVISQISAGDSADAAALVHIPRHASSENLTLRITAWDKRGVQIGQAEAIETWPLRQKTPRLALEHSLYDGTSPGSAGDRNGIASNAENVELGIVLLNNGDLAAHNVRFSIASDHNELEIPAATIPVGDLPPGSRAPEQRVPVVIPRGVGADEALHRLTFRIHLEQNGFPPSEITKTIAFAPRRPEILLDISGPESIARGTEGSIYIQIWNNGDLDAEGVTVDVETDDAEVELYEPERALPAQRHRFDIGTLAAGDRPRKIHLTALPRQESALTPKSIAVRLQQRDFAPTQNEFTLHVEDRPILFQIEPQEKPQQPSSTVRLGGAPSIAFQTPWTDGQQVKVENMDLRFEIRYDVGFDLDAIRLVHMTDGGERSLSLGQQIDLKSEAGRAVETYVVPVTLELGANHFIVTVATSTGGEDRRTLSLNRVPDTGRVWVVSIGIGEYSSERIRRLLFPRLDSQAVYEYYRKALAVPENQLFLLLDDEATDRRIKELLGDILPRRASNPDDTVIIYFAGHGLIENDSASASGDGLSRYFAPSDADPDRPYSTAINMADLGRIFARLNAERVVFFADTCFSGAAGGRTVENPTLSRSSSTDAFLNTLVSAKGRLILTASKAGEEAQERADLRHGVFTHHLLQGLKGKADADCDSNITFEELYHYTSRQVLQDTDGKQTPVRVQSGPQIGQVIVGRALEPCTPEQ